MGQALHCEASGWEKTQSLWEWGLAGSGPEVGGWLEESSRTTERRGLSPGTRGLIPLTEALGAQALAQDAGTQGAWAHSCPPGCESQNQGRPH